MISVVVLVDASLLAALVESDGTAIAAFACVVAGSGSRGMAPVDPVGSGHEWRAGLPSDLAYSFVMETSPVLTSARDAETAGSGVKLVVPTDTVPLAVASRAVPSDRELSLKLGEMIWK